jgi:hypothetical protein
MTERELELRLTAAARALDAHAPALDPTLLPRARPVRFRLAVVALAVAAVVAAPSAVSALRDLFEVESVPELGPVEPGVAPGFLGRATSADTAQEVVPFRLRTVASLGEPDGAYVREDIVGAMASVTYAGDAIVLTQWRADDVRARITIVPVEGTAEEVEVGSRPGLWVAGTARGTLTLTGADRAVHRELFDVADGALLWQDDGVSLLLQGAGSRENATRLAADTS